MLIPLQLFKVRPGLGRGGRGEGRKVTRVRGWGGSYLNKMGGQSSGRSVHENGRVVHSRRWGGEVLVQGFFLSLEQLHATLSQTLRRGVTVTHGRVRATSKQQQIQYVLAGGEKNNNDQKQIIY